MLCCLGFEGRAGLAQAGWGRGCNKAPATSLATWTWALAGDSLATSKLVGLVADTQSLEQGLFDPSPDIGAPRRHTILGTPSRQTACSTSQAETKGSARARRHLRSGATLAAGWEPGRGGRVARRPKGLGPGCLMVFGGGSGGLESCLLPLPPPPPPLERTEEPEFGCHLHQAGWGVDLGSFCACQAGWLAELGSFPCCVDRGRWGLWL